MFPRKRKLSKEDSKKLVTFINPKSHISEEFRSLRSNIQFSIIDDSISTIMVTSAGPGEGKSTISTNIAIVFAVQGKKVLLVDADLRRPSLHETFQVSNKNGLTTYFTRRNISLNQLIFTTPQTNLDFLPTGVLPPNPSELLSSIKMDELIEELRQTYDLIIFDVPPIIAVTDAQIIASKTDGTIFVVRNNATEKQKLVKSKKILEHAKAPILGVVFNDKKRGKESHYGYS